MAIVRPRLNDYFQLPFTQYGVEFAIPFLDEDIPLYLDPFLLWKSPSQADNSLHTLLTNSFNLLGNLYKKDKNKAVDILVELSECDEVGLGDSKTKHGKKMGPELAHQVLSTFEIIPQIKEKGIIHLEALQLLVENFSKDRISDISCNFLKSYLIDYSIQQSDKYGVPTESVEVRYFDNRKYQFVSEKTRLPVNPSSKIPVLFVPKRWLRFIPWINFDDYYADYVSISKKLIQGEKIDRIEVLEFNRKNYDQVQAYIKRKQLEQSYCKNDPLFSQIPVLSAKRKRKTILNLPTGKTLNADKEYENNLCPLLASMFYPELDFAESQSRTDSGVLIRDLVFYNNTEFPMLKDIYEKYNSRQIVFELKNVKDLETTHINQLNRYLSNEFGSFGVIFTRNRPPNNVFKNTIDLWSGQRKCIIILDDSDLEMMCQVYEDKQRKPIEVVNKKFVEFIRACPS